VPPAATPTSHNRVLCAVLASGPGRYHQAQSRRSALQAGFSIVW